MKHLKISTIVLFAMIISLSSCANKKKQKQELEVKKGEIAHIVSDYIYPLPSSFELMNLLNEIEAAYILGITNPAADVEKYQIKEKQSINLGIYLADLSYAAIYRRKKTTEEYLESCEKLVRSLHVDGAFKDGFVANVADNIDNKDSLTTLISSTTQDIYSEFHLKEETDLAYLMASGAWVESMYLTLIVSENTPLNAQVINAILYQQKSLTETLNLLQSSTKKPEVLITALLGIKNTFEQEASGSLTADQVTKLTAQVNALRAHFIK